MSNLLTLPYIRDWYFTWILLLGARGAYPSLYKGLIRLGFWPRAFPLTIPYIRDAVVHDGCFGGWAASVGSVVPGANLAEHSSRPPCLHHKTKKSMLPTRKHWHVIFLFFLLSLALFPALWYYTLRNTNACSYPSLYKGLIRILHLCWGFQCLPFLTLPYIRDWYFDDKIPEFALSFLPFPI